MDLAGVGDVIRIARRAAGLSQKDLARMAGISRATLNYLENEPDTDMGAIKLLHILDVLGIEIGLQHAGPDRDEAVVDAVLRTIPKRERVSPGVLREALITGRPPVAGHQALVRFLEIAPVPALIAAVRLAAVDGAVSPKTAWKHAAALAQAGGSTRAEWAGVR